MASEVASEVGKTILEKVIDPLANYVSTHASYTLRAGHHVQVLETEIERLKKKRSDVKDEIQRDERAGKVARDEIQGWLEAVDKLENDAGRIISRYRGRKCMCLGACSLDCFSNHSIGAEATNVTERVRKESGRRDGFTTITKEAPLPAVQLVPVETLAETSRSEIDLKLGEALDFLQSDREASLGIWGMGGVGKTTLLRHINNALAKDPSFERVVLVTASRDCTVEKIQKLIIKELKLESAPENHKNDIHNYLSKKNFVILLDDLWARLDLLEVGVPPLGMLGGLKQKLILTTRNEQVCHDMGASRTIKVHCLSPEAARLLFLEKVGEEVINSDPQIRALAEEVADECGGLPKAIICIARAMLGKRRPNLWKKAIEDLRKSNISMVVPGTEDPLPLLKVSYDYLEDPVMQESLLLCALWPEDYHILKETLIDCWMGHGLLGEFESMDEANNNGEEIIDKLEKASLLEYIEDEEDGECWVSLHDLIRDMALWIARDCGGNPKKWIVLDKAPQDEKSWMEARKMSIMGSELTTLPSVIMCSSSNLTTLILRNNHLSHDDLGILQHLQQLVYLDLSHNDRIERFPIEICHLHKLEFLELSETEIEELPDELQNLRNLKYLLMQETFVTEISSQLLSSLVSLEVLNVFNSGSLEESTSTMIDNLGCLKRPLKALSIVANSMSDLTKLTRMSGVMSIRRLHICVRDEEDLTTVCMLPPNSWSKCEWLHINGCDSPCTELVMDWKHIPSPMRLSIVSFRCLTEIVWKRVEPRNMNIRFMFIGFCAQLKHVTWFKYLPSLERLYLSGCTNLKQVFLEEEATEAEEMEEEYKNAFLNLKSLTLHGLPELETICNHAMTFPSLTYLKVRGCKKLKKLPLDSCSGLTKIVCEEEWWENLELDEDTRTSLQPSATFIYFGYN